MSLRLLLATLAVSTLPSACAPPDPGRYWTDYATQARAVSLLKTDRAPEDAPVDADHLATSFRSLAFTVERDPLGIGDETPQDEMIRKWRAPLSYTILAADEDEARIARLLARFTGRLRDITGHQIAEAPAGPEGERNTNVFVLFGRDAVLASLNDYADARAQVARVNASTGQAGAEETADGLTFLSDVVAPWYEVDSPCAGQVYIGDGQDGTTLGEVMFAVVMIRSELPQSLLEACVEEEIAQVTGLLNDDLSVRPTIFNDDQEFALLTDHDALLLRTLYDPRIQPGMAPATAMPLVREITRDLLAAQ